MSETVKVTMMAYDWSTTPVSQDVCVSSLSRNRHIANVRVIEKKNTDFINNLLCKMFHHTCCNTAKIALSSNYLNSFI